MTSHFTVVAGPDAGKVFAIDMLPAVRVEEFMFRVYLLAIRAGVTIPDDLVSQGVASLAHGDWSGLKALSWDDVHPLLAEMARCITYVPDPTHPDSGRPLGSADIEDAGTMIGLRMEWLRLHLPVLASARAVPLVPGIVTTPPPPKPPLAAVRAAGNA